MKRINKMSTGCKSGIIIKDGKVSKQNTDEHSDAAGLLDFSRTFLNNKNRIMIKYCTKLHDTDVRTAKRTWVTHFPTNRAKY